MDLKTTKRLLANQSKEELLKIIANLSAYSEEAEEWLLKYCEKHGKVDNAELVARKQIELAWRTAEDIIDESNFYGGTDGEEEVDTALFTIGELSKKYTLDWGFRQSLIDRMLEQFRHDDGVFEDMLIDACLELCRTDEEYLFLADRLRDCSSRYYRRFAAQLFLKHGDENSFEEVLSRNLEYGSDYIALADYYMRKKQPDRAIRLVETAVEEVDSRLDEVYEWLSKVYIKNGQEDKLIHLYCIAQKKKWDLDTMTRLMVEYYANDYEQKKRYLLKMPEVCHHEETKKWFDACRQELTDEDFLQAADRLHTLLKTKAPSDYLQLRIDENQPDEVLLYLQEHPTGANRYDGVDFEHKLSKQLANRYPQEVCSLYWRECDALCAEGKNSSYAQAVSVLREIKKSCTRNHIEAIWHKEYTAFAERHRRKRNLMGLIVGEKGLA